MASPFIELEVGERVVKLTNPDKVLFPKAMQDQARPRRVLRRGRRGNRPRAVRAADAAPPLPGRRHGRGDLPEARSREASGVGRGGPRDLPLGPSRRRALRHRARAGDLGGEPRRRRLPPVAVAAARHRASGRAAHRHRSAARHDVSRRQAGRGARARGARRDRLHGLAEDLGQPRHPRLLPDRAELGVPGRAPRGARVRTRGRAAAAEEGDDRVVEGGARQARLHRLQPERARSHGRVRVLGARAARRDRLRAGHLGRAARGRDRGLLDDDDAGALRGDRRRARGIDDAVCDLRVLLDWVERDEKEGVAEAPYPPNFPKMPGEPPRVQPSRARKPDVP